MLMVIDNVLVHLIRYLGWHSLGKRNAMLNETSPRELPVARPVDLQSNTLFCTSAAYLISGSCIHKHTCIATSSVTYVDVWPFSTVCMQIAACTCKSVFGEFG